MSVFLKTNHMMLRNPSGSDGNVAAMAAAGFGAIFLNVRDYPPAQWQTIRDRARQAGVACGPWARTATGTNWDEMTLQRLVRVADDWESPLIVNSEKELDNSGEALTRHLRDVCGDRDWALSMEAWPFSSVDWHPLADVPVLPQIFPAESAAAADPAACRAEWQRVGVRCVAFCFGAYGAQHPFMFDRLTPFGVYTADDCGGMYGAWRPLGSHDPCVSTTTTPEEGTMAPVTDQQARDQIAFVVQAAAQNWTDAKPRARLTVCRRVAQAENDDTKWNKCRDAIVKALDDAGVPA